MDHRAVSDNCNLAAVAQYFSFAYLQQLGLDINWRAHTTASRIAHGCWPDMLDHGEQHVAQLGLIFRGHEHKVGNAAQIRNIQQPVMRWTVAPSNATAIEAKLYIQILNADIVH